MFDPSILDDIAKKLADAVPPGVSELKKDVEKKFRSVLQGTFANLDLVTREEFDTQTKVLARTRQKLEQFEKQLQEIEKSLSKK